MVEQDTIKLLRECDAGVKMGVASIDDVLEYVKADPFKERLLTCKHEHEKLGLEIDSLLKEYKDEGKEPNPIAKGMSWMKTNMKISMDSRDSMIADLLTDGCDMGIKSLYGYLHEYHQADEEAQKLCNKLIAIEEELRKELQQYL